MNLGVGEKVAVVTGSFSEASGTKCASWPRESSVHSV
jgi:hypothetical protein